MSGIILFSLIVFAFRVAMHKECVIVNITAGTAGVPNFANRPISFKTDVKDASSFEWDFGDGSGPQNLGIPSIIHPFKKSGRYTISLLINGTCTGTLDFDIQDPPPPLPPAKGSILGPDEVYLNSTYNYIDTSSTHKSWKWYASDHVGEIGFDKSVQITFDEEGKTKIWLVPDKKDEEYIDKWVSVVVDPKKVEEARLARIKRQVLPEPSAHADHDKPTVPPITVPTEEKKEEVKKVEAPLVQPKVKNSEITPADFGELIKKYNQDKVPREVFNKYFCGEVTVTYEKEQMSFDKFLEKVLRMKKIKYVQVTNLSKNDNNCISKLDITVKGKFLGLL